MVRDLREAARQLGKAPGFTATALITLALASRQQSPTIRETTEPVDTWPRAIMFFPLHHEQTTLFFQAHSAPGRLSPTT